MHARDITNIEDGYRDYLTVERLLEFIREHNIDPKSKILVQRVEDFYFDENNWGTVKKEGHNYHQQLKLNEKVDSGEFDDKKRYPKMDNPQKYKMNDEQMDSIREEYIPIFCPVKYDGDEKVYLNLHY